MTIRYEVRDQIAHITMAAPPVNALSEAMLADLLDAQRRAGADDGVRAVVLASAVPGFFCAGLDLKLLMDTDEASIRSLVGRLYTELTDVMHGLGKPSIAAVSGVARGGGMTLAISCNVILASETASFGYPEIDAGLPPAIHFTHLPGIVGRHAAFELLFTGRSFGPEEALRLGLVNRVVPPDTLASEAQALGQVFAEKPAGTMRAAHAAFMDANDRGFRAGVSQAVETFTRIALSEDGREGVRAFAEKRRPGPKK